MRQCFLYILSLIISINFVLGVDSLRVIRNNGVERARFPSSIPQPTKESNILPIDIRSIKDWNLEDMLLVSDIDGNLHALERNTGGIIWTLPLDDPLVKILTNNTAENAQSNILWFVEPYGSGSLYYFTPKFGLNKLPASIKDLVMESPFSLNGDDKIYTGTRKTSLHSLNIRTGLIESSFGDSDQCHITSMYKSKMENADTIMIGKVTYELSIYSKENTNIVWNVTYSLWGPNNIDNDLIMQNHHSIDDVYFTPFHDKSILAINRDLGTPAWISKLPSLAVNVFDIFSHKQDSQYILLPHPLKVLNELQTKSDYQENDDMVFINKTSNNKEWFAMSFENYPTLIKSAPISEYQLSLYKIKNQIPVDVEYLKNFQLLSSPSELVEKLVNGVHEIFHLTSDLSYQPISKFDTTSDSSVKRITDGKAIEREDKVPNIIDSIKFPDELAVFLDEHELEILNSFKEMVPKSNHIINPDIEPLSITKRILEDVLVILAIIGVLVLFNKGRSLITDYKRSLEYKLPNEDVPNLENEVSVSGINIESKREIEISEVEKGAKEEDVLTNNLEVSNSDSSSELGHNSDYTQSKDTKKVKILIPNESLEKDLDDDNDNENEKSDSNESTEGNDEPQIKKKRKRGNRGGKRGGRRQNKTNNAPDFPKDEVAPPEPEKVITTSSLLKSIPLKIQKRKLQIENNLEISDKILGYGSHGTIVYQGTFENRPVAVKRMLLDFYDVASHEVRLLQESDDHPNVIRYFCSQSSDSEKFLYIALELCLCSLEDLVEKPKSYPKNLRILPSNSTDVLRQLASGLNYLHSLKIIHRDIKPQNILVADLTQKKGVSNIRLLISDFGLCKKLDIDQSSFRATTQNAALGTSGWRAPELLLDHDLMEISPSSVYSVDSTQDQSTLGSTGNGKRLTKAIDIFSLGCLFFYILSGGLHPFGDRYLREGNICKGEYDLSILNKKSPHKFVEAQHLISLMIHFNPRLRPNTATILKHPFFWSINTKLEFLLKVSDRFEIEQRDPPSDLLIKLESHAINVHEGDWHSKLDEEFLQNLGKYRKYNTEKLMDLLRAFRNKYHHFNDMPPTLQIKMSPLPVGFYNYFNDKFPNLLMEIFHLIEENLKDEHIFQDYF